MTHDPRLTVRNRRTAWLVLAGMFAVHALALGLALYWVVENGHPHDKPMPMRGQTPESPVSSALATRPATAQTPAQATGQAAAQAAAQATAQTPAQTTAQAAAPAAAALTGSTADTRLPDWLARTQYRDRPAPWYRELPDRMAGANLP